MKWNGSSFRPVNDIRAGRALRALRLRLGVRQVDAASRSRVGQSTWSLAERGHFDRHSLQTVRSMFAAVGASYDGVVTWRGGALDRLLDGRHASIVESVVGILRAAGWQTAVEVSFNHFGDRGSIDVLAFHADGFVGLVAEVKSELAAIEETVRRLDVKARLAPAIVVERFGLRPAVIGRVVVLPDTTTARQRVASFGATFEASLPARTVAVRRWIRNPAGPATPTALAGIMFLRPSDRGSTTRRPRRRPGPG